MIEQIKFKENPSAGSLGLEKEGRSKFPNCYDIIQVPLGKDGRWKTGLDEDAMSVNGIMDQKHREGEKKRIKTERETLERLTGKDLSATSEFWGSYYVRIDTTKSLDMSNPMDKIAYYAIVSSGEAAPSLRETKEAAFRTSKYYVARENEDVSIKVEKKRKVLDANIAFAELIKDPEKAILIGRYLNLPVSSTTPVNNIFDIYSSSIERDEETGFIDKFLLALSKTPEELNIKMIFDDAIKFKVIRLKDGYYQRGNITYGRTPKDALEFLTDPTQSGELLSVQDEIENKRKFG